MQIETEFGKKFASWCPYGYHCIWPGLTALLLAGVGTLLLAPVVIPAAKAVAKSVAKATIKGGIIVSQTAQELVGEVKSELEAAKVDG